MRNVDASGFYTCAYRHSGHVYRFVPNAVRHDVPHTVPYDELLFLAVSDQFSPFHLIGGDEAEIDECDRHA